MTILTNNNAPAITSILDDSKFDRIERLMSFLSSVTDNCLTVEAEAIKEATSYLNDKLGNVIKSKSITDLMASAQNISPLCHREFDDRITEEIFLLKYADCIINVLSKIYLMFNSHMDIHKDFEISDWCQLVSNGFISIDQIKDVFGEDYRCF